jgi:hypothetical protein
VIIGDLHGDFKSLSFLIEEVDFARNAVVFLGDYADRGKSGLDVIRSISKLVKSYPRNVIALKGNHEDYFLDGKPRFGGCTLKKEVENEGTEWHSFFNQELRPFISSLYLAAIIPDEVLFVHGGISRDINSYETLINPTRTVETIILWSDPFDGKGQILNKKRCVGLEFGEDVTEDVCASIGVKKIVRSHEPNKAREGPHFSHGGKLITISSTCYYGGLPFSIRLNPFDFNDISVVNLRH